MRQLFISTFVCFSLVFLTSCTREKDNWHENLKNIPEADKKALSDFFAILIKQNEFGFTIFGNKPVSVISYVEPDVNKVLELDNLDVHPILIEKGWKIWQKYIQLFPCNNFLFGKYHSQIYGKIISNIFLINKREIAALLKGNTKIHFSEQENTFSNHSIELLTDFLSKEKMNQVTLGIVLGYGCINSKAFNRRTEISFFYSNNPDILENDRKKLTNESLEMCFLHNIECSKTGPQINLEPSKGFDSIADEFNYLNCHLQLFELEGTALGITSFGTPAFVALNNEPETEKLLENYQITLNKMTNTYKNKLFLEATLEQLIAR